MQLDIVDPEETVVASFDMDAGPGAMVTLNGFHGSQTYTLSEHDTTLIVRFVGVENFNSVSPSKRAAKEETEEEKSPKVGAKS